MDEKTILLEDEDDRTVLLLEEPIGRLVPKNPEQKEIVLDDFKLQHNFEFIWEKDSLFTDKYISISEEFLTIPF